MSAGMADRSFTCPTCGTWYARLGSFAALHNGFCREACVPPVNKADYWARLKRHDWTYAFSDDARWYNAGRNNEWFLLKWAQERNWQHLYDLWANAYGEAIVAGKTVVHPSMPTEVLEDDDARG